MRAFIAIEIPAGVKEAIAAVQARIRSAAVVANWSRPQGLHLTLKFLGEVRESRVPEIMQAVALALSERERFRLELEGVGAFPNPAAARVVWVGIVGEVGKLVALQGVVDQVVVGLGLARDDRPYTPHLTIGRIRQIRKRAGWLQEFEAFKNHRLPGFDVTSICLMESKLLPSGAVYRQLGAVALQQRSGAAPSRGPCLPVS